jgi:topoisomerase-4 subunit A
MKRRIIGFRPNDKILIIQQSGANNYARTVYHFDSDMVVLENGFLKSQFQLFIMGEKQRYYIKRFLVETENKEELIITEHQIHNWKLSTDYRPVVELISLR